MLTSFYIDYTNDFNSNKKRHLQKTKFCKLSLNNFQEVNIMISSTPSPANLEKLLQTQEEMNARFAKLDNIL